MITKKKGQYRFYYHWVRQTNKWSVHFRNKCTHVDHLMCNVPCETKINKRQPYRVMQGFAELVTVDVDNSVARIL